MNIRRYLNKETLINLFHDIYIRNGNEKDLEAAFDNFKKNLVIYLTKFYFYVISTGASKSRIF